ncbi:MAG: DUF3493 domain-containing protein [Cyanobacteria bacterium J06639_1]
MPPRKPSSLSFDDRVRLTAELAAPYRKIRQFLYAGAGISGGLGGVVFFFRVLAGRELAQSLPNLGIQIGVIAGAIALFRWEAKRQEKLVERVRDRLNAKDKHSPPSE